MRRVSVPYHLARVGDIIDELGCLAVITHVDNAKDGSGMIRSVSADGRPHRLEWSAGTPTGTLGRLGVRCTPTPEGLRDFIAQQLD